MGFVDDYSQIKSVLWCHGTGNVGFNSLGRILKGNVNPSGKAADTFITDFTQAPYWNNFGYNVFDNMDEFAAPEDDAFVPGAPVHFVDHVEGIYVGYKYYETAAEEGFIDYDALVQYPFGRGLSYTTFTQEMGEISESNGVISFDVTVTNTGSVAGKDVVEVYYNPPYTNGGIEKASANLIAFDKTDLLPPGASQTITISFNVEDMASYDMSGNGRYVLEGGDYIISINNDSHYPGGGYNGSSSKESVFMKKMIAFVLGLALTLSLTACGQPGASASQPAASTPPIETPDTPAPEPEQTTDLETGIGGKTLVVYFSATGSTQKVARYIADALEADQFELVPNQPYTSADLSWTTEGSRVNREHDDESLRDVELVSSTVDNWADYDTIFIGYPIWWGIAAWPVNGFVKNNDFTGKMVIPFCTFSSSGLGESGELLANMAGTGEWQTGTQFASRVSEADVVEWVNGLGI